MAITVSSQDVSDAEDFLTEFISDKIADGDYTDGSALRDLAIKAISFVMAYLKQVDTQIRARQSLKSIQEVDVTDDAQAADDAVDEILSNWFAKRKLGKFARVVATASLSQRSDVTVKATDVFYKTSNLPFVLDNAGEDLQVAAEDLVAQFDSSGVVTGYTFTMSLVSLTSGESFNIQPGKFSSYTQFSNYLTSVETLVAAQYGTETETSAEFIARSTNLITVRNLINARSCDAVLRDTYPEVNVLSVIGMGDQEMIRDYVKEKATSLAMHLGGCQDIFISTDPIETSFSGTVGGRFVRPDGVINVFRDQTVVTGTAPNTFSLLGVAAGMVLRIWSGLPISARDYNIREVRDTELYVSEKVPFPIATDELSPVGYVTWSIGQNQPDYSDVITQQLTGETSKYVQNSGQIVLPGGPLYYISSVTVADVTDPDADASDGLIHFNNRMNQAPVVQVSPDNEYQVTVRRPENHQSMVSFAELILGPVGDVAKYDGKTVKVTYYTLTGFNSVAAFVSDRRQRIAASSPLVRAYHPVYLNFILEYDLKKQATGTVDATEAAQAIVTFINTFDPREVLDVTAITDFFRQLYSDVGRVYPFTIYYDLHNSDGRVIPFFTTEDVIIPSDPTKLADKLVSPTDPYDGLTNPLDYGISDDVVRYFALEDFVVVQQRT